MAETISNIKKNIADIFKKKTVQKVERDNTRTMKLNVKILADIVKELSIIRQIKEGSLKYDIKTDRYINEKNKTAKPENILKPTFAQFKPTPTPRVEDVENTTKKNIPKGLGILGLILLFSSPDVRGFLWGALKEILIGKDGLLPEPMKDFIKLFVGSDENNPTKKLQAISGEIDQVVEEQDKNIENFDSEQAQIENAADNATQKIKETDKLIKSEEEKQKTPTTPSSPTPSGKQTNIPPSNQPGANAKPNIAGTTSQAATQSTQPTSEQKASITKTTTASNVTPPSDDKDIMEMIKRHEGVRLKPYRDSLNLWTVGVGHLIGDGKSLPPEWDRTFTMAEVDSLFFEDYKHHKKAAEKIPAFNKMNKTGQAALIDLTFNMGNAWYKSWPTLMKQLSAGEFNAAGDNLEKSKWFTQVGLRGPVIVAMIRAGGDSTPPQQIPPEQNQGTQIATASATVVSAKKEEEAKKKVVTNVAIVTTNHTTIVPKRKGGLRSTLTQPA